jgi:hypothetical protein
MESGGNRLWAFLISVVIGVASLQLQLRALQGISLDFVSTVYGLLACGQALTLFLCIAVYLKLETLFARQLRRRRGVVAHWAGVASLVLVALSSLALGHWLFAPVHQATLAGLCGILAAGALLVASAGAIPKPSALGTGVPCLD